jgi:hypothetical protein
MQPRSGRGAVIGSTTSLMEPQDCDRTEPATSRAVDRPRPVGG